MKRLIFCALIVLLCGCKGGEKSVEMGPAETVEAFCKDVAAQQWDEALELCGTEEMKEYIDAYKAAFDKFAKEDEGAAKVAGSILGDANVTIDDVRKENDVRIVTYTLDTDGLSKTKKAILRKEEGAWRVEAITEAN